MCSALGDMTPCKRSFLGNSIFLFELFQMDVGLENNLKTRIAKMRFFFVFVYEDFWDYYLPNLVKTYSIRRKFRISIGTSLLGIPSILNPWKYVGSPKEC